MIGCSGLEGARAATLKHPWAHKEREVEKSQGTFQLSSVLDGPLLLVTFALHQNVLS